MKSKALKINDQINDQFIEAKEQLKILPITLNKFKRILKSKKSMSLHAKLFMISNFVDTLVDAGAILRNEIEGPL